MKIKSLLIWIIGVKAGPDSQLFSNLQVWNLPIYIIDPSTSICIAMILSNWFGWHLCSSTWLKPVIGWSFPINASLTVIRIITLGPTFIINISGGIIHDVIMSTLVRNRQSGSGSFSCSSRFGCCSGRFWWSRGWCCCKWLINTIRLPTRTTLTWGNCGTIRKLETEIREWTSLIVPGIAYTSTRLGARFITFFHWFCRNSTN